MGVTKTEMFTEQQNKISLFAKVFGHPARVSILQHLFKIDSCVCGDLVNEIGLAQPTISQHLKELKNLGLIKGNIEGTSVCYCIHKENWTEMKTIMLSLCTLTGVVDSIEQGIITLEVKDEKKSLEYISISNEIINPLLKEGDSISLVVLAGEDTIRFCSE